jgi:superoxide dismutase
MMTGYVRPNLQYDHGARRPDLPARILEIHHGLRHPPYVNKTKNALERSEEARREGRCTAHGSTRACPSELAASLAPCSG